MTDNHELMAAVELASQYYGTELMRGTGADRDAARGYIAGRQLFAPMVEQFRIGFVPRQQGGRPWILNKIPDADLLLEAGIIIKADGKYRDPMEGRIVFPQVNPAGKYIGFVGRSQAPKADKYLSTGQTAIFRRTEALYRIDKARIPIEANKVAIVVEGLLDAALLTQVGIKNVVATGTKSMTDPQAQILARYTNRVEVMFDNDQAGREGFEQMWRKRARHFEKMTWRQYPAKYNDPADWVAARIARNIADQAAVVAG